MAAPCKHWIVHRQICCRCKSPVITHDVNRKVARNPSLFDVCPHRMYQNSRCCRCGYIFNILAYILGLGDLMPTFNYIAKALHLSHEFEVAIKQQKLRIGLGQRKLHLVLGLEHVLIDSIRVSKLTVSDKYHLIKESDSVSCRDNLFHLPKENFYSSDILVKFRPNVREFLREAKEFFTMYVFTNHGPDYAKRIVKLLDPHRIYFGSRIITSGDSKGDQKSLELVLAEPRGVVILDYDTRLWMEQDRNKLLVMRNKYKYFKENKDGILAKTLGFFKNMFKDDHKFVEYLQEGKSSEEYPDDRNDIFLLTSLTSLKTFHELFFNEGCQNVSPLLPRVFKYRYLY